MTTAVPAKPAISTFERYLSLWVALCIVVGIALGTLDEDPGVRPECHIYVDSKAPWFEISDKLPQFAERAPDEQIFRTN